MSVILEEFSGLETNVSNCRSGQDYDGLMFNNEWVLHVMEVQNGQMFIHLPSGSRIPRTRERQHMILPKFPKNCMKLRKCWALGGALD